MAQQPQQGGNSKTILIVVAIIGVVGLFGLVCCVGGGFFLVKKGQDMDKTYYAECETLDDDQACSDCCRAHGHSGNVYGGFLNDEGKTCGCI